MIPKHKPIDEQAKSFIDIYVPQSAGQKQIRDMTISFKCGFLAGAGSVIEILDASEQGEDDLSVDAIEKVRSDLLKFTSEVMAVLDKAKANKAETDSFGA